MHSLPSPGAGQELSDALDLMTNALAILDILDAPGKIGATLDLAIASLSGLVANNGPPPGALALTEQLEWEISQAEAPEGNPSSPWEKS